MSKISILGAGMVGSAMAIDLSKNNTITVADYSLEALKELSNYNIETQQLDVTNKERLSDFLQPFDFVICAVPGFLGFETLKSIIEAKKNVVDISFFPEDALELDTLAKENNVTAIVDCGVAPGMGNIILGYHNSKMKINNFLCLVGGLPKIRKKPFEYKAPFSPIDVIEEYTRPARYVENSHEVVKPALSDAEFMHFDKVGTLEAFNTDGLRSLIKTMPRIPNMKEKTLRFPGHIDLIKSLKEGGFFNEEKIEVDGKEISPLEFTSKALIKEWKLGKTEEEFTVMRIEIEGEENGTPKKYTYDLFDEYCKETNTSSMARTTGYTATAVMNLLAKGKINKKGILPPELLGDIEGLFSDVINYLQERNIKYLKTESL